MKKETRTGKECEYQHTAWIVQGKVRNVYLENCKKVSRMEALARERRIKAKALGIEK